jgi:hypothetical protein
MSFAPIAIFACKRPEHLTRLLESLSKNKESKKSDVKIFIGGPKNVKDWPLVYQTVSVARNQEGFRSVEVELCFDMTTGAELIKNGVSQVLSKSSEVIVLEDDLVVRSDFLLYMNTSLRKYQHNNNVAQISAWNFGVMQAGAAQQTYFMTGTTSWGWATWRRAWNPVPNLMENFVWLTSRAKRIHTFNYNEVMDCLGMLEAVIEKGYDAWDVSWYLDNFRKGNLVIYPNSTLTINDGFDGSGLNFNYSFTWEGHFKEQAQEKFLFPEEVRISPLEWVYIDSLRSWIKLSIGKKFLFPYVIVRKLRQHRKYYKRGFYQGLLGARK